MVHPDARPLVALLLALLAPAAAAADAESVTVRGTRDAVSFEAHEAPYSSVRAALGAYGVYVRAGVDDRPPVTLSFAALYPRGAAERVGAALGGLLPLSVSWEDPGIPGLRETVHFLVRGATLARRMLEAACLPGPGAARARLQPRLLALGADLLPELRDYLATTAEERSRALDIDEGDVAPRARKPAADDASYRPCSDDDHAHAVTLLQNPLATNPTY